MYTEYNPVVLLRVTISSSEGIRNNLDAEHGKLDSFPDLPYSRLGICVSSDTILRRPRGHKSVQRSITRRALPASLFLLLVGPINED